MGYAIIYLKTRHSFLTLNTFDFYSFIGYDVASWSELKIIEITLKNRTEDLVEQLLKVWESSVRATHLFLSDNEIREIKNYIPQALHEIPHLVGL